MTAQPTKDNRLDESVDYFAELHRDLNKTHPRFLTLLMHGVLKDTNYIKRDYYDYVLAFIKHYGSYRYVKSRKPLLDNTELEILDFYSYLSLTSVQFVERNFLEEWKLLYPESFADVAELFSILRVRLFAHIGLIKQHFFLMRFVELRKYTLTNKKGLTYPVKLTGSLYDAINDPNHTIIRPCSMFLLVMCESTFRMNQQYKDSSSRTILLETTKFSWKHEIPHFDFKEKFQVGLPSLVVPTGSRIPKQKNEVKKSSKSRASQNHSEQNESKNSGQPTIKSVSEDKELRRAQYLELESRRRKKRMQDSL